MHCLIHQDDDIAFLTTPRQDVKRALKFSPKSHSASKMGHGRARLVGPRRVPQVSKKVVKPKQQSKKATLPSKKDEQIDTAALDLALSVLKQPRKDITPHDVMELYSRPRLVPMAESMGLTGSLSLDIVHGWDALKPEHQTIASQLLSKVTPKFLMTSPPCTYFSALMELWNFKKMKASEKRRRKKAAVAMVEQAVDSCLAQHDAGRLFAFEHPNNATSWKITSLKRKMATPGTYTISFDQCSVGLVSPMGEPIRKRTRLWTNSPSIRDLFESKQCACICDHRRIEGSQCGFSLSKWAQTYPPKMVKCLIQGASKDMP